MTAPSAGGTDQIRDQMPDHVEPVIVEWQLDPEVESVLIDQAACGGGSGCGA